MALNLNAIGKKIGPLKRDYTWKDVVLYALGVGGGFSDLEFCYEKGLKVIPSFSIAAIFDILAHVGAVSNFDLAGILHGEQELAFHSPIPTSGTLTTEGEVTHIYDKGKSKGALVVARSETVHSNGRRLFTSVIKIFARLDGGFGGENAPKKGFVFPDRNPDFVIDACPSVDQPLLYRLSGDTFDLHVNSEFARMAGFEKPIMHGLCTHGYACRALIQSLVPGRPERARRMDCRFTEPLYPGTPIQTRIWKAAEGKALWRTLNAETGKPVIDRGIFEYGDTPQIDAPGETGGPERAQSPAPAPGADAESIIERLPHSFNPEAAKGVEMVFQYDVSGSRGGFWHVEIKDGKCRVAGGKTRQPDCILKMADTDFVRMMTGRLDPVEAFMSGKLVVEGALAKAQLIGSLFSLGGG